MTRRARIVMLVGSLGLGGLWGVAFAFWTGRPWFFAIIAGLSLSGILQLVRKRRSLAFSGVLALLVLGIDCVSYALVPSVTFTVAAAAFPGHIVVEFHPDCPASIRRALPLQIEYVVPQSGYTCSSTPLPEYLDVNFALFDRDPAVRRATPPLAGGSFFATGAVNCVGASRSYVHKELAEKGTGGVLESWPDFAERVNFKCR